MTDGLAYFKAVYGTVPTWITAMHEHNPRMLKHYTDLRGVAFTAGALSSRDKDDLIMAVNLARLYALSMLNHVKGMVAAWPNSSSIFGWRIATKATKPC